MSFAKNITRIPNAYDPDRGADVLACLPALEGELTALISGAAGSSPYLADLIQGESVWLADALTQSPDSVLASVLDATREIADADLATGLRRKKRRIALLTALADLGGIWPLAKVTGVLTEFADLATSRALKASVAFEIRRGKLTGQSEGDIETAGGMVALAMGKMGAAELNYSSDIDLICLFDETRFEPDDYGEARAAFIRATRKMAHLLSDRTADGYVFRTDLRLRPDPSVTPVCLSMEAAERYYESLGRTWERAAYIKARPAAGDLAAGEAFLKTLTPFVWRRHLDFAAIQDAHDMRLRIREHKGLHQQVSHLGHDLKLGQGGIREIEFFTQTGQIISGGRDPSLRVRGTVEGLTALAAKSWVAASDAATLIDDYRAHREAEHRVQMIADQQTHKLPSTEEEFVRLAALSGRDPKDYANEIEDRLKRVSELTEGFFSPESNEAAPDLSENASKIVSQWHGYPALRSSRAVEIFNRVRPQLLARLQRATQPDEALQHIDGFLAGLPAGVQLFSLFEANPQLLDLVVDIADTAPGLALYLSRNAQVFDAVIVGDFFASWPGSDALCAKLSEAMTLESDYEARLDRARVWWREWHFRIGVHHLRGLIDGAGAGGQYADLAEAVVRALWPVVCAEFSSKHGDPPGHGAVVLGMGSLGAGRLTATSDLDLIVIYDPQGVDASDGRRPLASRLYYARLTQALVTALSAPTAEGRLYEVDMRLRPSGRQGPVATSLDSYRSYQDSEAWTWEHLALTRARTVGGSSDLGEAVETFRNELLKRKRDGAKVRTDVADMRQRLSDAKARKGDLDVKSGPGRMQDIELLAESGALLSGLPERDVTSQLTKGAQALGMTAEQVGETLDAYELFWSVQSAARLITSDPLDPTEIGQGAAKFLLQETGCQSIDDLIAHLTASADKAAETINHFIGNVK